MLTTKIEPFDLVLTEIVDETLGPAARSQALAVFAREQLGEAQAKNTRAIGRTPRHDTSVDGRRGADESTVKPDGVVFYEFDLLNDLFAWIADQLEKHAPVGAADPRPDHPGLYRRSFAFFADGVEVAMGERPPEARNYTFLNTQSYSRKIERGLSPQAPDGVLEAVAALAQKRFGNIARVRFTFVSLVANSKKKNLRQPAIVVTQ